MQKMYVYAAAILSFYICQVFSAITVNNQDINTLMKPGETLVYEFPDSDNIFVDIKDDNIVIGTLKPDVEPIQILFNHLNNQANQFWKNISKEVFELQSGKNITIEAAYFSGSEGIILTSAHMELNYAILDSKAGVVFRANQLKLEGCFFNASWLEIESNVPNSLCSNIRFIFNKNIFSFPACTTQGHINFENNAIKCFHVVGASRVEISFAPQAFENNQKADNVQ